MVDFDENTAFPVVADPTSHPNKTKTYYLTKSQVAKVRDKYAYTSNTVIVSKGIVCLTTGVVPALSVGWTLIFVANDVYDNSKKSTWDKLYKKFPSGKKYLKVTGTWKWHGGHKTYYPSGKLKTAYVKSK